MATTVASVIESARDAHPAFSQGNIPDGTAVRMLDKIHRRLYYKILATRPDLVASDNTSSKQAFANSTAAAGYSLPTGYIKLIEAYVHYDDGTRLILNLVDSMESGGTISQHPSAYVKNGKLYPIDPVYDNWSDTQPRTGWDSASSIEWHYATIPTAITQIKASGSNVNIGTPDASADLLVAHLAYKFAVREMDKVGPVVADHLKGEWRDAEESYLLLVDGEVDSEQWMVRVID